MTNPGGRGLYLGPPRSGAQYTELSGQNAAPQHPLAVHLPGAHVARAGQRRGVPEQPATPVSAYPQFPPETNSPPWVNVGT